MIGGLLIVWFLGGKRAKGRVVAERTVEGVDRLARAFCRRPR